LKREGSISISGVATLVEKLKAASGARQNEDVVKSALAFYEWGRKWTSKGYKVVVIDEHGKPVREAILPFVRSVSE